MGAQLGKSGWVGLKGDVKCPGIDINGLGKGKWGSSIAEIRN